MDNPPYKAIGFTVIVAAILVIGFFAYRTVDTVTEIIEEEEEENGSTPNIIVYGPGYRRHLLLGNDSSSIHVEVDHIAGSPPASSSLDVLYSRMVEVTGKQVTISVDDEIPLNDTDYNRKDLESLEDQHRDTPEQEGNKASVYILYLNGVYNSSSGVLGVSYNGTSFAIMSEQIQEMEFSAFGIPPRFLPSYEDFETSVLIHEMGHLWGLVNINYTSERNYEDPSYPHHSIHPDCVMFWALEGDPLYYLENWQPGSGIPKPPTTFHEDALFDLEQIKAGVY